MYLRNCTFMIKLMGIQAMEIAKIKDTHYKLKDKWCVEQESDIQCFFEELDNLVESSSNAHQSALAYQQAEQVKADFINHVLKRWSKYRLVEHDDMGQDYRNKMFKQMSDSQTTK